ncbi:hypothetical protein NB99_24850 [Xanthomonas citri pv. fuscans]|nr:hypothetical protein NB99_24850 [Xanthomonas citri pv. fuscans]
MAFIRLWAHLLLPDSNTKDALMAEHDGITEGLECDNAAVMAGFTCEVFARTTTLDLHLLIRPDTDLDGHFRAWCTDEQEWLQIEGWNFCIQDVNSGASA